MLVWLSSPAGKEAVESLYAVQDSEHFQSGLLVSRIHYPKQNRCRDEPLRLRLHANDRCYRKWGGCMVVMRQGRRHQVQ